MTRLGLRPGGGIEGAKRSFFITPGGLGARDALAQIALANGRSSAATSMDNLEITDYRYY